MAHRLAKHPESILKQCIPKTYAFEIAHADELDELFYDELYEVSESLDNDNGEKWWILKPAMADKGQGIRIFNSKETLQDILESFEGDSSDEEDEDEEHKEESEGSSTKVNLNSMRDWVIQVRAVLSEVRYGYTLTRSRKQHRSIFRGHCCSTSKLCKVSSLAATEGSFTSESTYWLLAHLSKAISVSSCTS